MRIQSRNLAPQAVREGRQRIGKLPRGFPGASDDGPRVSELRSVARVSLTKLAKQIETAQPKTKDAASAAHLEDTLSEIHSILIEAKKK